MGFLTKERKYFALIWVVTYAAWTLSFEMVGRLASHLPSFTLTTDLDNAIPLEPSWVWMYALSYAFPLMPLLIAKDWHRFAQGIIAFTLANFTAFIIYVAVPISLPQPTLGLSFSERLLAYIYSQDFVPSANKLPSMHVISAWLFCFMCCKQGWKKAVEWIAIAAAILISLSTVLVKQHLVIDVIAGMAWAVASWYLAKWLYARFARRSQSVQMAFGRSILRLLPPLILSDAAIFLFIYFSRA